MRHTTSVAAEAAASLQKVDSQPLVSNLIRAQAIVPTRRFRVTLKIKPIFEASGAARNPPRSRFSEVRLRAQEAVDCDRELVALNRDVHLPNLAMALTNLAIDLVEAGRRTEGVAAAQEAVDLRRELASTEPDRFDNALAASLALLDRLTEQDSR